MHRFMQRLFGPQTPATTYRTDGAAMAKLLVADGVGLTLLPDFSVVDDPLERAGLLAVRPLVGTGTTVSLTLLQRRPRAVTDAVRELQECFRQAGAVFRERRTVVPLAASRSGS
jgi:DNA-binding transcriptional LysR family regulator